MVLAVRDQVNYQFPGEFKMWFRNNRVQAASSDTTIPSSYAAQSQSPEDIMEMLRQRRCRVLKRVSKASRISAAEKL